MFSTINSNVWNILTRFNHTKRLLLLKYNFDRLIIYKIEKIDKEVLASQPNPFWPELRCPEPIT